jgi:hypothetical protein
MWNIAVIMYAECANNMKSKITVIAVVALIFVLAMVNRGYADPVTVSWLVKDSTSTPVDGASIEVYWATSPSGPFTKMPADDGAGTYVEDKIAGVRQNPIYTGYWNPSYPHGMGVCDIHPKGGLDGLYFYVKISYGASVWYWPTATSYKPGDPSWAPVSASGSPTGYAACGPGIGTGPTTAYPTEHPPTQVIPEIPLGSIVAAVSMVAAFGAYFGLRRRKALYVS